MQMLQAALRQRHNKRALLALVSVLTLMCVTLLSPKPVPTAYASGDYTSTKYGSTGVGLVLTTAHYDGQAASGLVADGGTIDANLAAIMNHNGSFANVGMLIGPRAESSGSSMGSTLQTPLMWGEGQIRRYDELSANKVSQYLRFGLAIHKLNERGLKIDPAGADVEQMVDGISVAAARMTNAGVKLLQDYNPAVAVSALYDLSVLHDANNQSNKLVQLINNNKDLYEIFHTLGAPSILVPALPLSFVITSFIALFLLITSVLMTLINGRAAGENLRKAMVRVFVASIAVPLIAMGLTAGVNFIGEFTTEQSEASQLDTISNHLNFADWYQTGFVIPESLSTGIAINKNNDLVMTPVVVREINRYTCKRVTGAACSDDVVAERITRMATESDNRASNVYIEPVGSSGIWNTAKVYEVADVLASNKDSVSTIKFSSDNYFKNNNLRFTGDIDGDAVITMINGSLGYGMSPIASSNLMKTKFTSTSITATGINSANRAVPMAAVAHFASTTAGGDMRMNSIIRFFATYTMVMAAVSGMIHILANGIGGVISGSAKATIGSSSGFGQAVGGVVALVGGILGVGIIMTLSFGLLDDVYGIVMNLFVGLEGDASLLDPITSMLEGIWLIGPLLASATRSFAGFVVTCIAAMTLPRFGAIPVRMFCDKMSELPALFAEKAQQMENRFTGDYRAGSGGAGSGISGMVAQVGKESGASKVALSAGAGAVGGFALSKAGSAIQKRTGIKDAPSTDADKKDGDGKSMDKGGNGDAKTADTTKNETGGLDSKQTEDPNVETTGDGESVETTPPAEPVETPPVEPVETPTVDTPPVEPAGDAQASLNETSQSDTKEQAAALAQEQALRSDGKPIVGEGSGEGEKQDPPKETGGLGNVNESGDGDGSKSTSKAPDALKTGDAKSMANGGSDGKKASGGPKSIRRKPGSGQKTPTAPGKEGAKSPQDKAKEKPKDTRSKGVRTLNAVGKGLSAAGGGTTGAQAAAGLAHIAGTTAGMGDKTQKMVDKTNKSSEHARQRNQPAIRRKEQNEHQAALSQQYQEEKEVKRKKNIQETLHRQNDHDVYDEMQAIHDDE